MTRILVTGSRDWEDAVAVYTAIWQAIDHSEATTIVHGGCPTGADRIAADYARHLGAAIEAHPAKWRGQGRAAGPSRNHRMVNLGADICLAFIRNGSRGATGCADLAEAAGIPTRRFTA